MKTFLVLLDFAAGKAVRYVGRHPVQTGSLVKPADEPWLMGAEQGLELLEQFRRGTLVPAAIDNRETA